MGHKCTQSRQVLTQYLFKMSITHLQHENLWDNPALTYTEWKKPIGAYIVHFLKYSTTTLRNCAGWKVWSSHSMLNPDVQLANIETVTKQHIRNPKIVRIVLTRECRGSLQTFTAAPKSPPGILDGRFQTGELQNRGDLLNNLIWWRICEGLRVQFPHMLWPLHSLLWASSHQRVAILLA